MRIRKLSILLVAVLVGTVFLSLAPTASAQQQGSLTITLNPPPENVKPLQGAITVTGTAKLVVDGSGHTGVVGIPVQFTPTGPAWASLIVSPASTVFTLPQSPAPSVEQTVQITVTVTASQDAPALTPGTLEVIGTTSAVTPNGQTFTGRGSTTITPEYFGMLDVQLGQAIRVERPQTTVTFPLKITNLGNGNTKITIEKVDPVPEGFQAAAPIPTTLGAKQTGATQTTADIALDVQTPYKNGYMNEVGVINYRVTSAYALDPKKTGDNSAVSVVITTRGFYVPDFSPLVMVGLVGAAALLLRRRE